MKAHARSPLRFHRPRLENLEQRLPPGDALLALLFGLPELDRGVHFNAPSDAHVDLALTFPSGDPAVGPLPVASRPNPQVTHRDINRIQESAAANDTSHFFVAPGADTSHVITAGANAWHPATTTNTGSFVDGSVRAASVNEPAARLPLGFHSTSASMAAVSEGDSASRLPNGRGSETSPTIDDFGRVPLTFEANHGQTDARVDFIARTGAGTVFLTPTAAVFSITQPASVDALARRDPSAHGGLMPRRSPETKSAAIHMQIVGANPDAAPIGRERQPGIVNYFIGNDPDQWHANIPTFGGVQYDDVYPGIDLVYYGNNGQLEYDFIVSPGVDPSAITLNFAGADGVEIDAQGDLVLHTAVGNVVQQRPLTYQEIGGARREVPSSYVVKGTEVWFEVAAYDRSAPLVIDPLVMGYSTYLGVPKTGGQEIGQSIEVDEAGSAYVTGYTFSSAFPITPGAFDTTYNGSWDVFVTKLNPAGSGLVYSTYLGGSNSDQGFGIDVDGSGNAYITGRTESTAFPTTSGGFDTTYNGGANDIFVTKLDATGSKLVFSTFLGGNSSEWGFGIAVDAAHNTYVTGFSWSRNFPTTPGSFDTTPSTAWNIYAVVTKVSDNGSDLVYSTFLGGKDGSAGVGLAVDGDGNAYVTGEAQADFPTTPNAFDTTLGGIKDFFVSKLNADGSELVYSTYLGGSNYDAAGLNEMGIVLDSGGNAYVTGKTNSTDFPTTVGAHDTTYNGDLSDSFVVKLNHDGSALAFGTFLGGSRQDHGFDLAVDSEGNSYIIGRTSSSDFPTTPDAFDSTIGGEGDAAFTKLAADGRSLVYSTYIGGSNDDVGYGIAVDSAHNAFVTGYTKSSDFPTTPGAFRRRNRSSFDMFVTKFAEV